MVVLAVVMLGKLLIEELWISFGTGKSFRYTGAHLIAQNIGSEKSRTLFMLQSLTECDTVSYFAGKEKKTYSDVWSELTTSETVKCSSGVSSVDIYDS